MASTVTRSQSNRAPLGCGGTGDSHHGCAADESAAAAGVQPSTSKVYLIKWPMDVLAVPTDRHKGWYLSLMAPNTKGPTFAWLDPSRLYCNSQALADCVKDLLSPFHSDTIDLVAGIDAMGFILGASVATTLGKGFLAVRKAGHLCVATQSQNYTDYTGREKTLEVRLDALKPGVRVLLVDQWIETGGTMKAAIQLVERLGATVVGVAAVAIENTAGGKWIKENYKFSHCIPEELQSQIDRKYLDSFKSFNS
ncbi:adenine phosphoribosyltransferase [Toxotes jaculatrix]|uniref:adenine phosphoribosyltransferase n=1 Tax=Toxotes jaculatrix TaxID=941984 RepID=UPI001B3B076A|nr:adenine phosphoribosyltransferase [Toxotes jaculatrix]XP_040902830.1 adenine phosphoribosyltransferase [Toxotes jaculatrix]